VECYERLKGKGPTGAAVLHTLSTGITYAITDKTFTDKIPIITAGYGRADSVDGTVFGYNFPLGGTYWDAADMLVQARAKILKNSWSHLQVMEMDALNLTFADNSFDYVTAFHTVTVVPDPVQMLAEAKRVCRPGGKIVIVNHFTTDLPIIGSLTEALDPLTRRLGWRTKLKLKPFLQATDFTVEEIYKLSKGSLYTVIRGRVV